MITIDWDAPFEPVTAIETIIKLSVQGTLAYLKCPLQVDVFVVIVSDDAIQEINADTRQKDQVTDVLSFPMLTFETPGALEQLVLEPSDYNLDTGHVFLGDVVLAIDQATRQAKAYGHSLEREVGFLTVHSILHLFGYDHLSPEEEGVMMPLQEKILAEMGLTR